MKSASIENFRWHDLRHTWASWHIQEGTPLHVLQELGGWSTPEMVQKYAHLSSEHLAQWVDRRPAVMVENLQEIGTFFTVAMRHKMCAEMLHEFLSPHRGSTHNNWLDSSP